MPSNILFHSSTIADLSEPISERQVAFILFFKTVYIKMLRSGLEGGHREIIFGNFFGVK